MKITNTIENVERRFLGQIENGAFFSYGLNGTVFFMATRKTTDDGKREIVHLNGAAAGATELRNMDTLVYEFKQVGALHLELVRDAL